MIPRSIITLFLAESGLIATAFLAAVWVQADLSLELFLLYENGAGRLGLIILLFVGSMYFANLYGRVRMPFPEMLSTMSLVTGVSFIAQALVHYLYAPLALPQMVMLTGSSLAVATILVTRVLFSAAVQNAIGSQRVLFLGASPPAPEVAKYLAENPEFGLQTIGYLTGKAAARETLESLSPLGSIADLPDVVDEYAPQRIVLNRYEGIPPAWVNEFLMLRFAGVNAVEVAALYESTFGRVYAAALRPDDVIFAKQFEPPAFAVVLQSVYGTLLAATILVLTFPITVLTALLIRLSSRGPVFERRPCAGRNGAKFTLYRFCCTEQVNGEMRGTTMGRLISRTGLAEMPQFVNVVLSHMSLVGPRPHSAEFASHLSEMLPLYVQRQSVKPGITGWARIHTPRWPDSTDVIQELEYDLYYIRNMSPVLDLIVLLRDLRGRAS